MAATIFQKIYFSYSTWKSFPDGERKGQGEISAQNWNFECCSQEREKVNKAEEKTFEMEINRKLHDTQRQVQESNPPHIGRSENVPAHFRGVILTQKRKKASYLK